jgi:dTDP-4-amino-4,6-dideoxygalactose transaminase
MQIPFNKPYMTGRELHYISQAHINGKLAGDGPFTKKCHQWLEDKVGCKKALLTHSCTAALEMAAILIDIQPGDEVIMPSYTFVSTANAFALRGGVPVFVDVRADTLNLDETKIEAAITAKTKAIVPVHYAGVGCEMNVIMEIAKKYNLYVIEDAAQGIMAKYHGRPLGSIGHLAAFSFHETKNIISGEGGALLINDPQFIERAEIIREKGTDRSRFFRGEVDKYSWVDIGSSFLPGELTAAFLWAQLEAAEEITQRRLAIWHEYHQQLAALEAAGKLRRPIIPSHCEQNAHIYYLLFSDLARRSRFIQYMKQHDIHPVFHYVPLHDSFAGEKKARCSGSFENTNALNQCLVRLPLWLNIEEHMAYIIEKINDAT